MTHGEKSAAWIRGFSVATVPRQAAHREEIINLQGSSGRTPVGVITGSYPKACWKKYNKGRAIVSKDATQL